MKVFKNISFLIVIMFCLTNMQCEDDDNYYNGVNHNLENNSIIQVENNISNLTLGETIYIKTIVENEQTKEDGTVIYLNNYSDENQTISYELSLFKLNSYGNIQKVALNNDALEIVTGETSVYNDNFESYISIATEFNDESFNNTFGIKPLETGTYYIGARFYTNNGGAVSLYTANNLGSVYIYSKIINSNDEGLYMFTVI